MNKNNPIDASNERVEFFEEDSIFSEKNNETLLDILEMNLHQIVQLKQSLKNNPSDSTLTRQLYVKAQNLLENQKHQEIPMNSDLNKEYQKQREWCLKFIKQQKNKNVTGRKLPPPSQKQIKVGGIQTYIPQDSMSKKDFNKSQHIICIAQEDKQTVSFVEQRAVPVISKRISVNSGENRASNSAGFANQIQAVNAVKEEIIAKVALSKTEQNVYYTLGKTSKPDSPTKMKNNEGSPNFILNTEELKQIVNSSKKSDKKLLEDSRVRPKIFGNGSRVTEHRRYSPHPSQPQEDMLEVYNHNALKNQNYANRNSSPNINSAANASLQWENRARKVDPITPLNKKMESQILTPNTAFLNKTGFSVSNNKKFSQFKSQKQQRRMWVEKEKLSNIQSFLFAPYLQFCPGVQQFQQFRRNCLHNELTLVQIPDLIVTLSISSLSSMKVKVEVSYFNNSKKPRQFLETQYRIPKCLKIEKLVEIKKRFMLSTHLSHIFTLELLQFPLETCVLQIRCSCEENTLKGEKQQNYLLPITVRNFINFISVSDKDWAETWNHWNRNSNFHKGNTIILQGAITNQEELGANLQGFRSLSAVEGFSVKEFVAFCEEPKFEDLRFLIRVSQRMQNIVSLEILASKKSISNNEADYLEYVLDFLSMLLARI